MGGVGHEGALPLEGLARQALARFGVGAEEPQNFADGVRRELYAPISAEEPAAWEGGEGLVTGLRQASRAIEVEWVRLPDGADPDGNGPERGGPTEGGLLGRTLGDLGVRSETGASVLAVVRGDEVIPNPGAGLRLEPGDAVGVIGTPEQRAAFRAIIGAIAGGGPAGRPAATAPKPLEGHPASEGRR